MKHRGIAGAAGLLLTACSLFLDTGELVGGDPPDAGGGETGVDAPPPSPCRLDAPFEAIFPIAGLENANAAFPRLSGDELTVYFQMAALDAGATPDIAVATRPSMTAAFGPPMLLTALNSVHTEGNPTVTDDGLELFFTSNRIPQNDLDIFVARRPDLASAFGSVTRLDVVSTTAGAEIEPYVTRDGRELWYVAQRTGASVLMRSLRVGGSISVGVPVTELNGTDNAFAPALSGDGLTIYFASNRMSATGRRVWTARRPALIEPFATPTLVSEIVQPNPWPGWVSNDGCRLYYSTDENPDRMYVASKPSR